MIDKTVEFTTVENIAVRHKCDFCGSRIDSQTAFEDTGVEWKPVWQVNGYCKTAIHMEETRDTYPDGNHSTYTTFHACPTCMKDIVFPTLSKLALNEPEIVEADW